MDTGSITDGIQEENRKLNVELRILKRELIQRDRTISALENNFIVKTNMFNGLVKENEKHHIFLTHLMKNSVDYLILVDSQLNIAYCSDSFSQKVCGEQIENIKNKSILDIYNTFTNGDDYYTLASMLALAIGKDGTSRHDIVLNSPNNNKPRIYRITNTPMLDKNVDGIIINWHDITDIKEAQNRAEEASRSKSKFLATMSHEIRTPMNAIIGITQIQLQKKDLPEEYSSALKIIHDSGSNLLKIINDILDLSKIETGKFQLDLHDYDIPSLINDTVQINTVRIGSKPIEFILDIDKNLPQKLHGDEFRIKQILNNLLSNAIKYTEKGYVKLSVSHLARGDSVILRFAVADTGQGIKQSNINELFTEYTQFNTEANRKIEGTGLGLAITKKLVSLMNGTIDVESEFGKGSIFTVTIKQKIVNAEKLGAELSQQLQNFRFVGEKQHSKTNISIEPMPYGKVLVVDDVESNLSVAEGLMLPYGLQIETVDSGYAAIDKVKDGETYDVIFMDHMMPGMDGIETTKKLREMGYNSSIVALTANVLMGSDEVFLKSGFDGFVSKPIDLRHLNAILNKFVRDKHLEEAKKYKATEKTIQTNEISPKLFEVFCRDAEKAAATLRKIFTENQLQCQSGIKSFTTTVHGMKSALANIGEKEKSALALELELASRNDNIEFVIANIESFIEMLETMIKDLTDKGLALQKTVQADTDITEDTVFLKEQLLIIKTACENYDDTQAYITLDLLKKKSWKTETSVSLERLRDILFLDSDFEEAASLVNTLLEK